MYSYVRDEIHTIHDVYTLTWPSESRYSATADLFRTGAKTRRSPLPGERTQRSSFQRAALCLDASADNERDAGGLPHSTSINASQHVTRQGQAHRSVRQLHRSCSHMSCSLHTGRRSLPLLYVTTVLIMRGQSILRGRQAHHKDVMPMVSVLHSRCSVSVNAVVNRRPSYPFTSHCRESNE